MTVLQGQSGPWVQERMPGFLASSDSRILPIPGGYQDVDLVLSLHFGSLCSRVVPRGTCYMYVEYMTWWDSPIHAGHCARCHTLTISFDLLNCSVLQSIFLIYSRGNWASEPTVTQPVKWNGPLTKAVLSDFNDCVDFFHSNMSYREQPLVVYYSNVHHDFLFLRAGLCFVYNHIPVAIGDSWKNTGLHILFLITLSVGILKFLL